MDIIDAAWALVEQDEILDFTVRQVIDRADVALQTFYRYFWQQGRAGPRHVRGSMRRVAEQYGDSATEDPVERLRHIVSTPIVMHFGEQGRRMVRWRGRERQRLLEFFPDAVEAVYEPYRAAIVSAIVDICQCGRGECAAPDVDAKLILHLVQEMAHGVHGGGIGDPPELVAERVWHMVWSGLSPRTPSGRATRRARG